jgi:hypothetical protein
MAHRSVRNVMPARSEKIGDKLMAALRYTYGGMAARGRKTAEYAKAPLYYDALWRWYQTLNADQEELVSHIIDAWASPDRRKAAEQWASHLPPAPQFPRELD